MKASSFADADLNGETLSAFNLGSIPDAEFAGDAVSRTGGDPFDKAASPIVEIDLDRGVSDDLAPDSRQVQMIAGWHHRRVDLSTADDVSRAITNRSKHRVGIGESFDAGMRPRLVAGQDKRRSPGQRASDRIKRLPPHDQNAAHRQTLETPQIVTQLPRHIVIQTDRSGGSGSNNSSQ